MENLTSIADRVQKCFNGFHEACSGLSKADISIQRKVLPWNLNDELGRFRVWCGNAAAHRKGKSSLEYKLRDASHIRERVLELLKNMETVLQEMNAVISGERVPWEDLSDSDSDCSSDDISAVDDDGTDTTELQQLSSNVAEIITCLMRLSIAIRNPAPHDQFKESTHIDTSHYESFDIEHVRGKFPRAADYLHVRLGKAISGRRQYLRYRDEHQKKFKAGLERIEIAPLIENAAPITLAARSDKIESTVASSIPFAIKIASATNAFEEDDYYEDTLSQTSYASSNNDPARLRPPPLPEQGRDGDPFECPICFRLTSIRQPSAWHKHVYRDLHPYVCCYEDCKVPDCTYESRHEWFNHEMLAHRLWWECIDGCNLPFTSQSEFREHLQSSHAHESTEDRVDDLVRSCERHANMDTKAECPLCQEALPSFVKLRRHLGKHHEELALFALPSYMMDDRAESDDEDINSRSVSSPASVDQKQQPIADHKDEFPCNAEGCGQVFVTGESLKAHYDEEHPLHADELEASEGLTLSETHDDSVNSVADALPSLRFGESPEPSVSPNEVRLQPQGQLKQIEQSITYLLVCTKQLLETLTLWSRGTATESEVSDVYVRLGYEFNVASKEFNTFGIDMNDLGDVPDMLRGVLEQMLSQEASQSSLDSFLPRIRDIITGLLEGLKKKQYEVRQRMGSVADPLSPGLQEPEENESAEEEHPQPPETLKHIDTRFTHTHLLGCTSELLQTLTLWSQGTATEGQVSDIYVRLVHELNVTLKAFKNFGVDTADLSDVPDKLRGVLEDTLGLEASQAALDTFLPRIQDVIDGLIQGIKEKQQVVRQFIESAAETLEPISEALTESSDDTIITQKKFYQSMANVLTDLKASEVAHFFVQDVNPLDPRYPYFIKQPVDLGIMTQKLRDNQYKSKKEFVDDLMIVWSNCLAYQPPDHPLHKSALSLREETEKLVSSIPDIIIGDQADVDQEPEATVIESQPTVRDHTTAQLNAEGDEYIPREIDEAGETKASPQGQREEAAAQANDTGAHSLFSYTAKDSRSVSLDRPMPPCPRTEFSAKYDDWYTFADFDRCPDFDICPSCYDGVFDQTPYAVFFSAVHRDDERICDFSSPWMRLAWMLTIAQKRNTPDLMYQLTNLPESVHFCPGIRGVTGSLWYGIRDERTGVRIPNFSVCPSDVRKLEALCPSLRGYFTILPDSMETCSFRFTSRKSRQYLDLLVELDAESRLPGRSPDFQRFVKLVHELDGPNTEKDNSPEETQSETTGVDQGAHSGPSSYWTVQEQDDFINNIAHFGTDFAAIAAHMGTKTETMVRNQYLRMVDYESDPASLVLLADKADERRERGEDLGLPPTPTPAPPRRYESSPPPLSPVSPLSPSLSPTMPQAPSPPYEPSISSPNLDALSPTTHIAVNFTEGTSIEDLESLPPRSASKSSEEEDNDPSQPVMYDNPSHNDTMAALTYNRSFSDTNAFHHSSMEKPEVYRGVYSGVSVYEMEVNRVVVMRRRSDGWLNATHILKVAGVDKGKRVEILRKEILTGVHEQVQSGYGKYQGTWINYLRGRELCRQYGVEDILRPLLEYNEYTMAENKGWQTCYSCKALIELKEGGSNHMTCRCTAQFCTNCALPWKTCNCPWFNAQTIDADGSAHDRRPIYTQDHERDQSDAEVSHEEYPTSPGSLGSQDMPLTDARGLPTDPAGYSVDHDMPRDGRRRPSLNSPSLSDNGSPTESDSFEPYQSTMAVPTASEKNVGEDRIFADENSQDRTGQIHPLTAVRRPLTRDGNRKAKPEIIIQMGSKKGNGKKYRGSSTAIGSDDDAIESPGSDASYTLRTSFSEAAQTSTDATSYTAGTADMPRDMKNLPSNILKGDARSTFSPMLGVSEEKRPLSDFANKQIHEHIIEPILADDSLREFHPLINDVLRHRIGDKQICNLRDLEKTLVFRAPDYSATPDSYIHFCERSITLLQATYGRLPEQDQRLPTDRPYTTSYFVDLLEQIRRYAAIMAATQQRLANGEEIDDMDYSRDEKITLRGGLSTSGRPVELVRENDEMDDEDISQSMARRRQLVKPGEVVHSCSSCNKTFKRPSDLTKHEKTHNRPWKCPDEKCKYHDLGWPTEKECQRHWNDKHRSDAPKYECGVGDCTYSSKRESNCKQHREKAHQIPYVRSKSNGRKKAPPAPLGFATPTTPLSMMDDFGYFSEENDDMDHSRIEWDTEDNYVGEDDGEKEPARSHYHLLRDAERAHQRKARADADKKRSAKVIAEDEEMRQAHFELGRAEAIAKERAEIQNQFAQHQMRRAEEREAARRQRQQEQKDRAAMEAREEADRLREDMARKEHELRKTEPSLQDPTKRQRRSSVSHHDWITGDQLLAEREAAERLEREEHAALLLEQEQQPQYWNPRGGRIPMSKDNTGVYRRNSVSGRRSSISSLAHPLDLPTGIERRNSQRRLSVAQHATSQDNPFATAASPMDPWDARELRDALPRSVSGRRGSVSSKPPPPMGIDRRSSQRRVSVVQPATTQDNPFVTAASPLDPWDARELRDAPPLESVPAHNRQRSDDYQHLTLRRRGEEVIKRTAAGVDRSPQTTRNSKIVVFEDENNDGESADRPRSSRPKDVKGSR